jgi:hypothetical protein
MYRPLPSVVPLAVLEVPRFRVVKLAPGTTAPEGSVTVPPIAPSVVDCAAETESNNGNAIIIAIKAR